MKKFLLINCALLFSASAFAEKYKCYLNMVPPGKAVSASEAGKYIKRFDFDPAEQSQGKIVKFDGRTVFLWHKKGWHNLVVKKAADGKNNKGQDVGAWEIKTKYPQEIKEILFQLSSTEKLKCLPESVANRVTDKQEKFMLFGLGAVDPKASHRGNWEVEVLHDLVIYYNQVNVNDKMRPIVFQDGKKLTSDTPIDRSKDYCQFQVKVKYDDNVDVTRGTTFQVSNVDEFKQGGDSKIVSYNFVDFGSGRSSYQGDATYEPFILECRVEQAHTWAPEDLTRITHGAMKVVKIK